MEVTTANEEARVGGMINLAFSRLYNSLFAIIFTWAGTSVVFDRKGFLFHQKCMMDRKLGTPHIMKEYGKKIHFMDH